MTVIARLDRLTKSVLPVLVGASRKRFIHWVAPAPPERRLGGSIAAHILAVENGAAIIRTHDVAETVQAMRIVAAIRSRA
jgi:dihydropteroate synthase